MPYYQDAAVTIYQGDCRDILPTLPRVDLCLTDPPYGETSLPWDRWVDGWLDILSTDNLWCFGSMRMFMERVSAFRSWRLAQDIVWEKHNGSGFHADRFKRIHEHVCQFYRGEWANVYKKPVTTPDAVARVIRTKAHPPHMGRIEATPYVSEDGGPRLQRSIIKVRSCHGYADHPTQKPVGIIIPLLEYSVPPNGIVLDPFAGSGSTSDAARRIGLRSIGIEIDERACEAAAKRMSQAVLVVP